MLLALTDLINFFISGGTRIVYVLKQKLIQGHPKPTASEISELGEIFESSMWLFH